MARLRTSRPARSSGIRRHAGGLVPGLALIGTSGSLVLLLGRALSHGWLFGVSYSAVSPLMLGMLAGAVAANVGLVGEATRPGATFAAKRLLRLGVALLGFRLALGDVAELGVAGVVVVAALVAGTVAAAMCLGRRLRVHPPLALLVATGFAVCGTSAAAAVKEVAGADDEDMAQAVGLITLCGTIGVFVLPLLAGPLGLNADQFGLFAGASVHDVGQVVAAASAVSEEAAEPALLVKLLRVALLAPIVTVLAFGRRDRMAGTGGSPQRPPVLPLFVAVFLVAAAVRSSGMVPQWLLDTVLSVNQVVLTLAMVGLGAQVRLATLRSCGVRPLGLAGLVWSLILVGAYVLAVWL